MLFLRLCLDRPEAAHLRAAHRAAHRAYLAAGMAEIIQAGPLLAPDGAMLGSMMIVAADSLAEVQAFHDADPFTVAGLFGTVHLLTWDRHIG